MHLNQFTGDNYVARQYEYDDEAVLAVDFGSERTDATVDVVDGTVSVVVDDDQYEFDLPAGVTDPHTFIRNGVLTIELEDH